jgi:hypothetical protein
MQTSFGDETKKKARADDPGLLLEAEGEIFLRPFAEHDLSNNLKSA